MLEIILGLLAVLLLAEELYRRIRNKEKDKDRDVKARPVFRVMAAILCALMISMVIMCACSKDTLPLLIIIIPFAFIMLWAFGGAVISGKAFILKK
jgi:hypothetical protein